MLSVVLIIRIPSGQRQQLAEIMGWGPDCYSVPLSADGRLQPPIGGCAHGLNRRSSICWRRVMPAELSAAGYPQAHSTRSWPR